MRSKNRLLFVCRHRECYWGGRDLSSGLKNSVRFIVDMLTMLGIEAKMVDVVDNNAIDREVTGYKPTHTIIEAFWVVPEKFDVLKRLHPRVTWIVRNHSEVPFLANEGIAFGWISGYLARNVEVMCNSPRARADLAAYAVALGVSDRLITYGPNYYPLGAYVRPKCRAANMIDIACFGAIRPLKNQMIQALAALQFAHDLGRKLRFHVNASRVEGRGDPILKNLRAALGLMLVEHDWLDHVDFLKLLHTMDLSLQMSFSETFNIVSADAVAMSVPVVVSPEVAWLSDYAQADPTRGRSIVDAMSSAWFEDPYQRAHRQRRDLEITSRDAEAVWEERFG